MDLLLQGEPSRLRRLTHWATGPACFESKHVNSRLSFLTTGIMMMVMMMLMMITPLSNPIGTNWISDQLRHEMRGDRVSLEHPKKKRNPPAKGFIDFVLPGKKTKSHMV